MGRDFFLANDRLRVRAVLALGVFLLVAAGLRAGSLSGISPAGASAGNTIAITGTGFNTVATNNQVTFTPAAGPAINAVGSSVATLDSATGLRRLQVVVPAGLPIGLASVRVKNTVTGEISQGKSLQILELQLPGLRSGTAGASGLPIRITGSSNCQFAVNGTRVAIGSDVTIMSTTVESATSLVVVVSIPATAAPGPRTISVMTGSQNAQLVNGFDVTAPAPPNRNPSITSTAITSGREGSAYAYDVDASDPDAGDVLAYSLTQSPPGMTINSSTGVIAWTPAQSGEAAVTATVSDGRGGSAQQSFVIAVAAANHQPSIGSVPVIVASEQLSYAYDVAASDPDTADILTYSLTQAPSGMTIDASSGLIAWMPTSAHVPEVNVTVSVSDGKGGNATQSFTVSVTANHQPAIGSLPNTSATEGQTYTYDVEATDPDASDQLAYELTQAPSGMTIDSTSGLITWVPGSNPPTSAHVVVTVSDHRTGIGSQSFDINVARAALGRGVIVGWVYDDSNGVPLQNASAQLLDASGVGTGLPVQSDALGRFRLSAPVGPARLRITKPSYTAADLAVTVVDSRLSEPDDARLTPLNPATVAISSVGGGTVSHRDVLLTFSPGGLSDDRLVTLTEVGPQGMVRHLPLGWAPLAGFDVAAGQSSFGGGAVLAARASSPAGRDLLLARWDESSGQWVAAGSVSRSGDGLGLEGTISRGGQYAFAISDLSPNNPPVPATGSALTGLTPRPPPPAQLSIDPAPRILYAQATARSAVTATLTPAVPVASGTPLQIDLAESFTFADGLTLRPAPGRRRFVLYSLNTGQTNAVAASFTVVPSRTLAPFSLRDGAIDLAGRLAIDPIPPRGRVFAGNGGEYTSPTGERIIVPAGAAAEDLPIELTTISAEDFPLALPPAYVLHRAFTLDLHGAMLTRDVQVAVPGAPAGSIAIVVQLVDVGNATRMVLVAVAQPQGDALITTVDPLANAAVRLPGIRAEGRYAVLLASGTFGYVTGLVTADDGSPVAGALLDASNLPIGALSDGAGRYTLLAPAGPIDIRVTNPQNGDRTVLSAQVTGNFGVTDRPAPIGASPPTIVATSPTNGAGAVALGSTVTVTFSEPINPATAAGAIALTAGGTPVAGSVVLAPDNTALTFRPAALLLSNTRYTLSITSIVTDTAGHPLVSPFLSQFTTVDVTPPPPPPAGTIVASIPDANGTTIVTGTQGTADPGGVVIVRNLRNNALTTLTPNADGSFSGVVAALRSDRLELTIRDAAGNATTVPVDPFKSADGSVVVGSAGGRVEGPAGTFVDVPAGALPDGTVVRLTLVAPSDLPVPVPDGYPLLGAVRLDLGGVVASQTLDLGIPAPPDATADDQILVGRAITINTGPAWTLAERALLEQDKYRTATPPFPGILSGGVFAFFRPGGCVSYVSLLLQHFENVLMSVNSDALSPFVYTSDVQSVVLANRCDQPLTIQVHDVSTNELLEELDAHTPAASGAMGTLPPVTDDHVPPRVLRAQTFAGSAVPYVELDFSEPMDNASVRDNLRVQDADGIPVFGRIELSNNFTVARFYPNVPFTFGTQYHIKLSFAKDVATNLLADTDVTFTPVNPGASPPLSTFSGVPSLAPSLTKCADAACNTSVRDTAQIGNVLFLANGLANATERYTVFPPHRLIAVDVKQPADPLVLGWTDRPSNPRVLAAIPNASFTTPQGLLFNGDLLLVASGGRVLDNVELPTRLEVYNVQRCTRATATQGGNCLDHVDDLVLSDSLPARRGEKLLSTPSEAAVVAGVPVESGVPQQMAILHQHGTAAFSDTVAAYVVVSGVGLAAIDVTKSFNLRPDTTPSFAPDGIIRGDFLDVSIIRNRVFAVEVNSAGGDMSLAEFSPQLTDKKTIPLPGPASRVAVLEGLVVDVDNDGRVGSAEAGDEDSDPQHPVNPADELFDLAIVSSGPLTTGCPANITPCGKLYIVDVSGLTVPSHQAPPALAEEIPLPGQPFSVQVDPVRQLAYVELRGQGLAIVDLSHLRRTLQQNGAASAAANANQDGSDNRVLAIVRKPDIFAGEVHVDMDRGIAFLNGSTSGLSIARVADCCTELSLDYQSDIEPDLGIDRTGSRNRDALLREEKARLFGLLEKAHIALVTAGIAVPTGSGGAGPASNVSLLEQGSGACFWGSNFDADPSGTCSAFDPATSDHDVEVFVPQNKVAQAQDTLDEFVKRESDDDESPIHKVGPLTLYAFSKEAFEAGELLVATPLNKTGDGSGDLAMGRQTLLLLWLLEGEYVAPYTGKSRTDILSDFKLGGPVDPNPPVVPGEPSRIPRLEGYEWSLLQEYNFYKSGGLLRLAHVCESGDGTSRFSAKGNGDINDPDQFFDDNELFTDDCVEQLRTIGKAGIRTVMARLIANTDTNPTVLDVSLFDYRTSGCRTGVADPANPPASFFGYSLRGCGSFEEFIASKAIESVGRPNNTGPFHESDLPLIFTFYCVKVWEHCNSASGVPTRLLRTDREINEFIAKTLAFIVAAQVETKPAYDAGLPLDAKKIGDIPSLAKITPLCTQHGVPGISPESPRSELRRCNAAIVGRKLDGDASVQVAAPLPFEVVADADRRKSLAKRFGAKNIVFKNLRVRAVNSGSRAVADLLVRFYEGPGTSADSYTDLHHDQTIAMLNEGAAQVIETIGKDPAYPVAFWMPGLALNGTRALAFSLDPERRFPERDKEDNQAGFFYYKLNPAVPAGPTGSPAAPAAPIRDTGADALCLPTSGLELTMVAKYVSDTAQPGSKEISVGPSQRVELDYSITNSGTVPLTQVTITASEPSIDPSGPFTLQPAAHISPSAEFTPPRPAVYEVVARASGRDSQGNWIDSLPSRVRVTVVPPACTEAILRLDPDPNPVDEHGQEFSSVMLGGRLYRYYRLVDGAGRPLSGTRLKVQKGELPSRIFTDVGEVFTGTDGAIVHSGSGGASEPGLRLDSSAIGDIGQRFEFRVFAGDQFNSSCDVSFQAEVTPRQFTASIKGGAAIEAEGAIEVNLAGRLGSGFEFKLDRETDHAGDLPVDLKVTINRSMEAELGAGLELAKTEAKLNVGTEVSIGTLDPRVELKTELMLRDRHEFTPPLRDSDVAAVGQLLLGLVAVSAVANSGIANPAIPLLSLGLAELAEHVTGLSEARRSFGGGVGLQIDAGVTASAAQIPLSVAGNRSLKFSVDADVKAAAIGAIDVLTPASGLIIAEPSLEYRADFDVSAALGAVRSSESQDATPQEAEDIGKLIDFLAELFQTNGAAHLSGTIRFAASLDVTSPTDPTLKGITISVTHKKNYGFTALGEEIASGGDAKVRRLTFRITDRDPARLVKALATLSLVQGLSEQPSNIVLGPSFVIEQLVKVIRLSDDYDQRVESGRGVKLNFGLGAFLEGVGLDGRAEFRLDALDSHVTEHGTFRRSKRFILDDYNEVDPGLVPPSGFDAVIQQIQDLQSLWKTLTHGYTQVTRSIGAARTLVQLLFGTTTPPQQENVSGPSVSAATDQSPAISGVELDVDGAAEATPFDINLIGFQYRHRSDPVGQTPGYAAAVAGDSTRPHYGIGGFFYFSPSTRTLAAPAHLAIHYTDEEIAGFNETSLAVYRWSDSDLDWVRMGGVVDPSANTVTLDITSLGLYTVAPAMPVGRIAMASSVVAGGTPNDPTSLVTFTSSVLRLNTGAIVPDGTLFTVHPIAAGRGTDVPIGTVTTPDAAPAVDGIQVTSQGGVIRFVVELPGTTGVVVPLAFSVDGTAIADQSIVYQRPQ